MLFQSTVTLALVSLAFAHQHKTGWETRYTATGTAEVAAAAATAKTSSPTSKIKGKAFDRIAIIYFENENYEKAFGDRKQIPKLIMTSSDNWQPTSLGSDQKESPSPTTSQ